MVGALRSGKYTQCIGQLRTENSFCFAGVACDIYDNTKWEEIFGIYLHNKQPFIMSKDVQSFYGFRSPLATFVGDPFSLESLSEMNDGGCSFEVIADTIEWGWANESSEMFEVPNTP